MYIHRYMYNVHTCTWHVHYIRVCPSFLFPLRLWWLHSGRRWTTNPKKAEHLPLWLVSAVCVCVCALFRDDLMMILDYDFPAEIEEWKTMQTQLFLYDIIICHIRLIPEGGWIGLLVGSRPSKNCFTLHFKNIWLPSTRRVSAFVKCNAVVLTVVGFSGRRAMNNGWAHHACTHRVLLCKALQGSSFSLLSTHLKSRAH